MSKLKELVHDIISFSPVKTLIFNLHYFGVRGLSFPVIIGRKFKLQTLKGTVTLPLVLPHKIYLGRDDFGWMKSAGYWINEGNVHFEGHCYIGNGTRITVSPGADLCLGSRLYMSGNDLIICRNKISLGPDSMISWNVTIMDSDLHNLMDADQTIYNLPKDVSIGTHAWIGFDTKILKGSVIPDGCVVAAGSIISKEFSQKGLLLGGTNNILKNQVQWTP